MSGIDGLCPYCQTNYDKTTSEERSNPLDVFQCGTKIKPGYTSYTAPGRTVELGAQCFAYTVLNLRNEIESLQDTIRDWKSALGGY